MSSENDISSILLEGGLSTKIVTRKDRKGRVYQINGQEFVDFERDDKEYQIFEVYKKNSNEEEYQNHMERAIGLQTMEIQLTAVPYGYIVNGTIYLTEHQWHTIIFVDITLLHCAICDFYTHLSNVGDHLKSNMHIGNLDVHKPLAQYDLSITRKINAKYHCGVCNQIFKDCESDEHYNSMIHESNLLFALNKATDVMFDSNTQQGIKKDVYHYNEHNMSLENDSSSEKDHDKYSSASNNYYSCDEGSLSPNNDMFGAKSESSDVKSGSSGAKSDSSGAKSDNAGAKSDNASAKSDNAGAKSDNAGAKNDYSDTKSDKFGATTDKFWDTIENTNLKEVDGANYTNAQNNYRNIDFYKGTDCAKGIDFLKGADLYYNRKMPSFDFPPPAFADHNESNNFFEDEFYDLEALNSCNSYANKARTPKEEHEEVIEVDFAEKRVKVKFDSWHMIIYLKSHIFYCMACKHQNHIKQKLEHCKQDDHLSNLARCTVVDTFKDYFVRQLDEKLYHCGHCNKLQLIDHMEAHIESEHPKKTVLNLDNKPKKGSSTNTKNKNQDLSRSSTPTKPRSRTDSKCSDLDGSSLSATKCTKNNKYPVNKSVDNHNDVSKNNDNGADVKKQSHNRHNDFGSKSGSNTSVMVMSNNGSEINNTKNTSSILSKPTDINDNISNKNEDLDVSDNYNDNVTILPFGYKIIIPRLSYNIICVKLKTFYCALCDVTCKKDVLEAHLEDLTHVAILNRIPFILPFGYHLIRAIREALHCAICNCPVQARDIYPHIELPRHKSLLQIALNINPVQRRQLQLHNDNVDNDNGNNKDNRGTDNAHNENDDSHNADNDNDNSLAKDDTEVLDSTLNTTEDVMFDFEENVYLKLKNSFVRVSNSSYHSLVSTGDAGRYCFVCETPIDFCAVLKHVESRAHAENIEKNLFLDKREDHLLRQSYFLYHCGVCNVLVYERDLKTHLDWATHLEQKEWCKNIKEVRRHEIKGSVKEIVVNVRKETVFLHGDAPRPVVKLTVAARGAEDLYSKEISKKTPLNANETKPKDTIYSNNATTVNNKENINNIYTISNKNTVINNQSAVISKTANISIPKNATISNDNRMISPTSAKSTLTSAESTLPTAKSTLISADSSLPSAKSTLISSESSLISNKKAKNAGKKSKMVIIDDSVYVIPWEHWNAIAAIKNGYKCLICQKELRPVDIDSHCHSEWHSYALDKPFEKQYGVALIRKLTESTLNCVTCNAEVSNKPQPVAEHIKGKRHVKNHDVILSKSLDKDGYGDCSEDIVTV